MSSEVNDHRENDAETTDQAVENCRLMTNQALSDNNKKFNPFGNAAMGFRDDFDGVWD